MAGNIYLYLDGVPGESTSEIFENWIDILSLSVGVSMEVDQESRTGSGGGTSGAADPEDFSLDAKMSAATPTLMQCCATGAIIPRGRLVQCNVINEFTYPVSDFAFSDSIITNVSVSASGGGIPDQALTINYGSIIWSYYVYDHYLPSVEVACMQREWSLLSANPLQADPNALDILSSFSVRNLRSDQNTIPYRDIGPGDVSFPPGKIIDMPRSGDNN